MRALLSAPTRHRNMHARRRARARPRPCARQVAQLAGYVSEHSAYHHGEASLQATIVGLAQDFVGSNNVNLLVPSGQFGTRLQGGKDAASPRCVCARSAWCAGCRCACCRWRCCPRVLGTASHNCTRTHMHSASHCIIPGRLNARAGTLARARHACAAYTLTFLHTHAHSLPALAHGARNATHTTMHAPPRYIYTRLAPLARHVFNKADDALLAYLSEEGQSIEPEWCAPRRCAAAPQQHSLLRACVHCVVRTGRASASRPAVLSRARCSRQPVHAHLHAVRMRPPAMNPPCTPARTAARYMPILPLVLINGAEGIGTGWSTFIPNYSPRDVAANLKRLLAGQPLEPMQPWYRGFK